MTAAGRALREAQISALKGRDANVRQATEDHRKAVAAAVREGLALAANDGLHPAADQLARMLEAMSLARDLAASPGRLTELIQPSGFEALAGITPSGGKHAVAAPASDASISKSPASGPRLVTSAPAFPRRNPVEARRRAAEERKRAAEERQARKGTGGGPSSRRRRRCRPPKRNFGRSQGVCDQAEQACRGSPAGGCGGGTKARQRARQPCAKFSSCMSSF